MSGIQTTGCILQVTPCPGRGIAIWSAVFPWFWFTVFDWYGCLLVYWKGWQFPDFIDSLPERVGNCVDFLSYPFVNPLLGLCCSTLWSEPTANLHWTYGEGKRLLLNANEGHFRDSGKLLLKLPTATMKNCQLAQWKVANWHNEKLPTAIMKSCQLA